MLVIRCVFVIVRWRKWAITSSYEVSFAVYLNLTLI